MTSWAGAGDPAVLAVLRIAGALLFAAASLHKLRDRRAFREALSGYRLLPSAWLAPAAIALPGLELATAVALGLPGAAVPGAAGLGAAVGSTLLGVYAAAIGVNLARGRRTIDCGCGGPGGRRPIGPVLVWRNAVLVAGLLLAVQPASDRPWTWIDSVTVVAGVATLALLYSAFDVLLANRARLAAAPLPGGDSLEARWATH